VLRALRALRCVLLAVLLSVFTCDGRRCGMQQTRRHAAANGRATQDVKLQPAARRARIGGDGALT
jgi:hypothetical protein